MYHFKGVAETSPRLELSPLENMHCISYYFSNSFLGCRKVVSTNGKRHKKRTLFVKIPLS